MYETEIEKIFALPDVKGLLTEAANEHNFNPFGCTVLLSTEKWPRPPPDVFPQSRPPPAVRSNSASTMPWWASSSRLHDLVDRMRGACRR
jgi:hypothetical protein